MSERDEFERWAQGLTLNPQKQIDALQRKDSGDYLWAGTALAWKAWQAALARYKSGEV